MYALESHWQGFKINDVIVFIDLDDSKKINWVNVASLSKNAYFPISLKNAILESQIFDAKKLTALFENSFTKEDEKKFEHKPMNEFAYLASEISLPPLQESLIVLLISITSFGFSLYFRKNQFTLR